MLHETAVTSLRRDGSGRVRRRRRPYRQTALASSSRPGSPSVPTGSGPVVAEQVGAQDHLAGTDVERGALPLRRGPAGATATSGRTATAPAAGVIPTNDGASCVFVGTTPARMRRLRRLGVERGLRRAARRGRRPAAADAGARARGRSPRSAAGPASPGYARHSSGPGWALVGDAGYFKDPITSHGITDALRDAELLADAGARRPRRPASPEHVALARYQETRDRLSRELFAVTERVAAYDWDADGIRSLLRRFSAAMADEVEHLEPLDAG